jgi:hypothetical protein
LCRDDRAAALTHLDEDDVDAIIAHVRARQRANSIE